MRSLFLVMISVGIGILPCFPQSSYEVKDYLRLNARTTDPLFTTYAAAMERSRLYGDKAYKMDYYSGDMPVSYSSDQAGRIFSIWKVDQVVIMNSREYLSKPLVNYSFPDMAILEYEPFRGIRVTETFLVYSSKIAFIEYKVTNMDTTSHDIQLYPVMELGNDSLQVMGYDKVRKVYITHRYENPYRLISSLKMEYGYPTNVTDIFTAGDPESHGAYQGNMQEFYTTIKTDYYSDNRTDSLNDKDAGYFDFISLQLKKKLNAGETTIFRILRGSQGRNEDNEKLICEIDSLKHISLDPFFEKNIARYSQIPLIPFKTNEQKLVYLGALNLVRGCMYPPSGKDHIQLLCIFKKPIMGLGTWSPGAS